MAEWCRRLPAGSTVLIEPLAGCVISSDRTATEAETRADLSRYATICGLRILGLAAGMGMVTPRSVDVAG
jgi:hypothetical protein